MQTALPIDFEPYNIFKTDFSLSYTPGQKYITEPTQKIVLGSRWPTFRVNYIKGWKGVFDSGVDFDQVKLEMSPYDLTKGRIVYRYK